MEFTDQKTGRRIPIAIVEFRKVSYNDVYLPEITNLKTWSFKFVESIIKTSIPVENVNEIVNIQGRKSVVWLERDETVSSFMNPVIMDVEDAWRRIMSLLNLIENVVEEVARFAVMNKKIRKAFVERVAKYVQSEEQDVIGDDYCDDVTGAMIAFRTRLMELAKLITAVCLNYRGYIPMFDITRAKDGIYQSTIEFVNNIIAVEEATEKKITAKQ